MEFRRKNLIKEAELPFATGKLVPYEPETEFDTGDYHVTFERAVSEIGWEKNKHLQGKLVDGRYHGLAAVPFVESGGSGKENARLVIEKDGSVSVYVGSSVLGQGLETTLAQVAADTLKLPFERDQDPARLDHLCARGLRHLCVALDGGRRLGGDGRLQQSAGGDPRGGDASGSAFRTKRSRSRTAR